MISAKNRVEYVDKVIDIECYALLFAAPKVPYNWLPQDNNQSGCFCIHYKGVFFLTQKILPSMNDGGKIIHISSSLARVSFIGSSAYASMKGAVEVLTRYLAKERGARGIAANVIAPGAIETDFGGGRVRDDKNMNAHIAELTALGRVGLPEDIGGVVAFLCSAEARWINGQRIEISGGMNL